MDSLGASRSPLTFLAIIHLLKEKQIRNVQLQPEKTADIWPRHPRFFTTQTWVVLLQIFHAARPIRSTTQIWVEFLRSFLISHFAGKPLVASPNVDCFLRLLQLAKALIAGKCLDVCQHDSSI